jgi:hypothetical protein
MNPTESKPATPEPIVLTCYCCRSEYQRGRYNCCAARDGMKSHVWLAAWCDTCGKCPRHCLCETRIPRERSSTYDPDAVVGMTPIQKTAGSFQGKIWRNG